jgi:hypothetical protein
MTPRYQLYLSVSKVNSFGVKDAQGINFAKLAECALNGGQFQAAVLTGCWACRSSYCAGLR